MKREIEVSGTRRRSRFVGAAFAAFVVCANAGRVDASGLLSGMLTCSAPAGFGFIIGSNYAVDCVFEQSRGGSERYVGDIQRVGVDLGLSAGARMAWAVMVSDGTTPPTLAGDYVGPSAGLAPGIGLGVNVLVGGGARSISLQPVSIELKAGLNLAVGVAALRLRKP